MFPAADAFLSRRSFITWQLIISFPPIIEQSEWKPTITTAITPGAVAAVVVIKLQGLEKSCLPQIRAHSPAPVQAIITASVVTRRNPAICCTGVCPIDHLGVFYSMEYRCIMQIFGTSTEAYNMNASPRDITQTMYTANLGPVSRSICHTNLMEAGCRIDESQRC